MTVCLAMIVKDEQAAIGRCLASALPHIDAYSILDTGSTDCTKSIIREVLKDVPGVIHSGAFVNFGVTRSWLMRACPKQADYLMLLDADMQVVYDGSFPELTAEVYEGTIEQGSQRYALPILVRNDREWRYEGVAHSYLACDSGWNSELLPGLRILDGSHTTVEKLQRDLELLRAEHAKRPLDARTAFYLAQTYSDLDMIPEAIQAYRVRAHLDGWDEETFVARHRLGTLLCENVSFAQGARELLAAWEMRPGRAEPLRALAAVAESVADKIPYPTDRLFVRESAYAKPTPTVEPPPLPSIAPARKRRKPKTWALRGLDVRDVSAVLVTRGNVDVQPVLAPVAAAGIEDIVVWDNSKRDHDYKAFGRYAAIPETKNPVIYWVDDDVRFTAFPELLAAYEPGKLVCNMDADWVEGAGYSDLVGMQGAGSLCDADLPAKVWASYFQAGYAWDDDALTEADFIFGVLAPFKVIDVGYDTFSYTDDADRLYTQPGQTERKWRIIERCRLIRDQSAVHVPR